MPIPARPIPAAPITLRSIPVIGSWLPPPGLVWSLIGAAVSADCTCSPEVVYASVLGLPASAAGAQASAVRQPPIATSFRTLISPLACTSSTPYPHGPGGRNLVKKSLRGRGGEGAVERGLARNPAQQEVAQSRSCGRRAGIQANRPPGAHERRGPVAEVRLGHGQL